MEPNINNYIFINWLYLSQKKIIFEFFLIKEIYRMIAVFLVIIFSIAASLESAAYGFYEISSNKNKLGGIILLILSLIGLFFPTLIYLSK